MALNRGPDQVNPLDPKPAQSVTPENSPIQKAKDYARNHPKSTAVGAAAVALGHPALGAAAFGLGAIGGVGGINAKLKKLHDESAHTPNSTNKPAP